MPVDMVRDAAVDVLLRVFERGVFLDVSLDRTLRRKDISDRGRRFLTHLVYGTVRHRVLCDYILQPLLEQTLDKLPMPIHVILRMGVYQALFLSQVTFPAMVHTSVDLAKKRGHAGTSRLVNAVLKKVPQTLDDVTFPSRDSHPVDYMRIRYSMPRWIVDAWFKEFGLEGAEAMCEASNEHAPTTLRINTVRTSVEAAQERLLKTGYLVEKRTPIPEELTLIEGTPPARSKLFHEGLFIIQDPASMLPPHLLEPKAGDRVLDMSAAPGGKTTHMAQLSGNGAWIVAMDVSAQKLELVSENLERLGLSGVHCVAGKGERPPFTSGFNRVLVDAPCTGLGTLRRHPDMKWRLKPSDPEELAAIQLRLLRSALALCENGGLVVYSVCTLSKAETVGVVDAVLEDGGVTPDEGPAWLDQWKIRPGMYRILPQKGGLDGFFLMRLRKGS
ncbi:MAG: 16S rRNA (cytosine(967)-C(5))-methyltransferase RsmB [FCB group bacterium]|jgi:16S rRNA (cytosine967-C5)-methyltransferase|nr:16S rRNA (cytosine(967)-C(5))-methyltransferase RsmB [FCB group bacterium]